MRIPSTEYLEIVLPEILEAIDNQTACSETTTSTTNWDLTYKVQAFKSSNDSGFVVSAVAEHKTNGQILHIRKYYGTAEETDMVDEYLIED